MNDNRPSKAVRCDRYEMVRASGWFFAICFIASMLTACGPGGVPEEASGVHPLLPGMTAPAFEAIASDGQTYFFEPGKADKPLVVTFYRGGWCPYCSKQLMAYRQVEKRLIGMGFEVLFVSPDLPETSAAHLGDGDFEFTLLSDSDMAITKSFGLAFRLDDETFNRYLNEYGFDLEGDSGQTHHYLPVPATYLIGTDGIIDFMYVNPNYKVRLDPELLEAAARSALH